MLGRGLAATVSLAAAVAAVVSARPSPTSPQLPSAAPAPRASAADPALADEKGDARDALAADFAESCRRLNAGSNPYFGTGIVDVLRQDLAADDASASSTTTRVRLGRELLRLGDTADAIEHLSLAVAAMPAPPAGDPAARLAAEWSLAIAHLQRAEDLNCIHHPGHNLGQHAGPDPGSERRPGPNQQAGADPESTTPQAEAPSASDGDPGQHAETHPGPGADPEPQRTSTGEPADRVFRSADSCILPLAPSAVHARPEHARAAGDGFLAILRQTVPARGDPPLAGRDAVNSTLTGSRVATPVPRVDGTRPTVQQIRARWLLNLARRLSGDFPEGVPAEFRIDESVFLDSFAGGRWRNLGPQLGVDVLDLAGGAVIDDFDGDGLLDLVTSTWDPCGPLRAFRNDGRGGFEDMSAAWGLDDQVGGLNLVHADYDDDGRLDLLVLRGAWLLEDGLIRNSLLRNDLQGDSGRFVDVTEAAGLAEPAYPTQTAAWGDYDGDGDLDLYVGNEATEAHAFPSQLFRNRGDGTFEDVAAAAGVTNMRYAKGVAWGDVDNDGDLDLYVSNFGSNRLYVNDEGAFVDVAVPVGVTEPERESFATWFFDYDHDGDLDLYVGDYRSQATEVMASFTGAAAAVGQPLLYRNDCGPEPGCGGRLRMTEVSRQLGIERPAMPMGANYGDLDNDGWLDFYLGTGEPDLASLMPNAMYRYDGRRFEEVTFAGGFGHLQKGHGVAFGDLDGDGDLDLLHQLGGFYPGDSFGNALFENPGSDHAWITLRFVGAGAAAPGGRATTEAQAGANRFGVGSRVAVSVDDPGGRRTIHRLVGSGGSFGGNSMQLEVGLGEATRIHEIRVRWAGSGRNQRFLDVEPGSVYVVVEGTETLQPVATRAFKLRGPQ